MTLLRRLLSGVRALVRRRRDDAGLDDELRAYLDAAIEAGLAAGQSRADAARGVRWSPGFTIAVVLTLALPARRATRVDPVVALRAE